ALFFSLRTPGFFTTSSSTYSSAFLTFCIRAAATPEIHTLSLHDALPIYRGRRPGPPRRPAPHPDAGGTGGGAPVRGRAPGASPRSEEHTSELQSRENLVCRLLLEKKNKHKTCAPNGNGPSSRRCCARSSS